MLYIFITIGAIIILGVSLFLKMKKDLKDSSKDFQGRPMKVAFQFLINHIVDGVFNGNADVIVDNQIQITILGKPTSTHKIILKYVEGNLTLEWGFLYLHQELKRTFNLPGATTFSQKKWIEVLTEIGEKMSKSMQEHAEKVNLGVG